MGHIDLAVYTGQFTRDDSAGIDVFIVGEVNPNALAKYIDELEAQENKSLRYTVMSLPDFQYRQQIRDRFAVAIAQAKKQVLVDLHNLLIAGAASDSAETASAPSEPADVSAALEICPNN